MEWQKQLQRAREEAGHTQREAAEEIGVSVSALESWEQGRRTCPNYANGNAQQVKDYVRAHLGESITYES